MEFYYFGGYFDEGFISRLEDSGFSGVMFTHDLSQGDMFTKVARDIKYTEKIKYLVAIRPYTISPQYLCIINQSINSIMKERLQINLISGYPKENEIDFGGILGSINDLSSKIDRSKYLIEYVNILNTMPGNKNNRNKLDFYVSATNKYVLEAAQVHNNKIILPYRVYVNQHWFVDDNNPDEILSNKINLKDTDAMIAITPVFRKTEEELRLLDGYVIKPAWRKGEKEHSVTDVEYFTYEQFNSFIDRLEKEGIKQILMNAWPPEERDVVIEAIKEYTKQKEIKQLLTIGETQ